MTDIYIKNPLIGYTGEKLNIIKINIENADGSTKSENQEGTEKPWTNLNGSSFDAIGGKSSQSTEKKKDVKIKEQKNLGKKSKRKKDKKNIRNLILLKKI